MGAYFTYFVLVPLSIGIMHKLGEKLGIQGYEWYAAAFITGLITTCLIFEYIVGYDSTRGLSKPILAAIAILSFFIYDKIQSDWL